ncbi:MAG TPA: hypothetical protein VGP06_14060 [Janthinobacterium sp.]|jgi:hypothetical protein|nr:hypothetical protein [Janthinobacterium sp.]
MADLRNENTPANEAGRRDGASDPGGRERARVESGADQGAGGVADTLRSAGAAGGGAVTMTGDVLRGAINTTENVGSELVGGVAHLAKDIVHGVREVGGDTVHAVADLLTDMVGGVRQIAGAAVGRPRPAHQPDAPHASVHDDDQGLDDLSSQAAAAQAQRQAPGRPPGGSPSL